MLPANKPLAINRIIHGAWLLFFFGIMNLQFSFSEEIRYQSGDRRDPFIPVTRNVTVNAATGDIQVEGIIFDPHGKSMVVMHGQTYKEGDEIGDKKIVSIQSKKIVVSSRGVESEYWISNTEQELAQQENIKT